MDPVEPQITDHALLRFIERICGFDMAELRARILTPAIVAAIKGGAATVVVEGITFVVDTRDKVIVTTLGPDQCTMGAYRMPMAVLADDDLRRGLEEYRIAEAKEHAQYD